VFAYTGLVSVGFLEQEKNPILTPERYVVTVAIAASIIAAVRLAKVTDLDISISKVLSTVQQSVRPGADDPRRSDQAAMTLRGHRKPVE
jgi:hypothetical protein